MKKHEVPPEGIVITVGAKMIGTNGYRHWLKNFLHCMKISAEEDSSMAYWFRQGNQPKNDELLRFVYLCIGGKIRYRCYYAGSKGEMTMQFDNRDDELHGKAWILVSGPVMKAPSPIKYRGRQGFRYTEKIF